MFKCFVLIIIFGNYVVQCSFARRSISVFSCCREVLQHGVLITISACSWIFDESFFKRTQFMFILQLILMIVKIINFPIGTQFSEKLDILNSIEEKGISTFFFPFKIRFTKTNLHRLAISGELYTVLRRSKRHFSLNNKQSTVSLV